MMENGANHSECISISPLAFTLCAISRRDVAARWTLKMGQKEINRVVYTRRYMARCRGRRNDALPEMSPAPILSRRSAASPQIL